jgi:hypothetical protein
MTIKETGGQRCFTLIPLRLLPTAGPELFLSARFGSFGKKGYLCSMKLIK